MTILTKRKAVALISGGLDSMLATKAILEQGIHVEGLNFFTGFCIEGHTQAIRKRDQTKQKRNNALWVAEQLGIKLHIIDIVEEYKAIVMNPKHGYGANLNPCLDCKIFMVGRAREWMEQEGFDFIITGEVVGQRPKSQRKHLMPIVQEKSGAHDRLLRPLSAQNLVPTLPEREGWVNREQLFGFSGRNRNPQMTLAKRYGIQDYAQPAGGCCFLTDESYSTKLKDLWQHRGNKNYDLDDILLLKVGRHLRPRPHFKLIIGREEGENNYLEGYCSEFIHLRAVNHMGPLALLQINSTAIDTPSAVDTPSIDTPSADTPSAQDLYLAAQIVARFTSGKEEASVAIAIGQGSEEPRIIEVPPLTAKDIPESWYITH